MDKSKACIFNIQKFSLHDGPGIRTVVFFKGCPLRCPWCSNPESQNVNQEILWDQSKCTQCLKCVNDCTQEAISFNGEGISISRDSCIHCGKCVSACPQNALKLEGKYYSISEVVDICMQDLAFYEESGGGVTLSGGEVLMQHVFAAELLSTLKRLDIHTAIESTGYASPAAFASLLPYLDLLLFDLKHWDDSKHFETVGVSLDKILTNLRTALNSKIDIVARIPVIREFNSSLEDAERFSMLLKSLGISRVDLLPFHQFGEKKYDMLGKKYSMRNIPALHKEDLLDYRNVFLSHGLDCQF